MHVMRGLRNGCMGGWVGLRNGLVRGKTRGDIGRVM